MHTVISDDTVYEPGAEDYTKGRDCRGRFSDAQTWLSLKLAKDRVAREQD
ncbi:hypothetical protein MASR2M48_25700 [Spirochaetota bacterium]